MTRDEIKEVLIQAGAYGGLPVARTGFREAQAVFAEIDFEAGRDHRAVIEATLVDEGRALLAKADADDLTDDHVMGGHDAGIGDPAIEGNEGCRPDAGAPVRERLPSPG